MKLQSVYSLLLVVTNIVAIAPPVYAVEAESIPPTPLKKGGNLVSPTPLFKGGAAGGGISGLVVQQNSISQVTDVRLQQTDKGLAVILETAAGESLQVIPAGFGKTFVANIPNAQAQGKTFRQENPASGIASIAVTQQGTNNIRITVTGTKDLPKVVVGRGDRALTLTLPDAIAPTAQQPAPPAPAPPETETTPEETSPQPELLPTEGETQQPTTAEGEEQEIVVTGEQETGYSVPNATTATKTDTPLRDIPQSIQVVPRQVIEDRQVVRFSELADNVSGVQPQSGYGGLSSQGYYLRGFPLDFEAYRNGFRDFGFISPRDVANVEQVEFLKGPASVLYGSSFGFSGLVNTVTKKPQAEPFYRLNGTIGNYDFYRSTLDFTGSLTEDKSLLYRLNIAYENADSFRDFNQNESIFIAPSLTWQIGSRTTLTAEL